VWAEINGRLKGALPHVHASLKRWSASWRASAAPLLPVPLWVRGDFYWVHPRVLTLETGDSEPHIARWILAQLPVGGVFFDVGAHFGWLSLKAARHVGRRGRVVAFEPSPALVEILKYHQRRNRVKQMTVVAKAVSDTDAFRSPFHLLNGGLSFRNSVTIDRAGLPFLDGVEKSTIEVPSLTLDSFCREENLVPDAIKIDVEGGELLVLRGASETLLRHHPALILSVHPYWLPPSHSVERIFEFLEDHGYRVQDSQVVRFNGYEIGDYLLLA